MEELRVLMCLYTVAADANGEISFQHYTLGSGIVGSCLQLYMKQILDVVNKFLTLTSSFFHLSFSVSAFPPSGIRFQPVLVGDDKVLIVFCSYDRFALFCKQLLQVFCLYALHGLVVAVWQCVQFLTTTQVLGHALFGA